MEQESRVLGTLTRSGQCLLSSSERAMGVGTLRLQSAGFDLVMESMLGFAQYVDYR